MNDDYDKSLIPFLTVPAAAQRRFRSSDLRILIERFRENSPAVPLERLYEAYLSLREHIESSGPEFASQSNHFNDVFLRILEGRGEIGSDIYRAVLRDSSEYRLLHGILGRSAIPQLTAESVSDVEGLILDEIHKNLTLKEILSGKGESLQSYDKTEWDTLVDEHFISIAEESRLVKSCGQIIGRILKRSDYQDYHLESVIDYCFRRLLGYDELNISTKEFAMKSLNLMSRKGDSWNRLHHQYLEIIKK